MTIGELKAALKETPDELEIVVAAFVDGPDMPVALELVDALAVLPVQGGNAPVMFFQAQPFLDRVVGFVLMPLAKQTVQ